MVEYNRSDFVKINDNGIKYISQILFAPDKNCKCISGSYKGKNMDAVCQTVDGWGDWKYCLVDKKCRTFGSISFEDNNEKKRSAICSPAYDDDTKQNTYIIRILDNNKIKYIEKKKILYRITILDENTYKGKKEFFHIIFVFLTLIMLWILGISFIKYDFKFLLILVPIIILLIYFCVAYQMHFVEDYLCSNNWLSTIIDCSKYMTQSMI